jgi:hypothetical protein
MIVSKEHLHQTVNTYEKTLGIDVKSILPTTYNLSNADELYKYIINTTEEVNRVSIIKRFRGRQSIDYPITPDHACAVAHVLKSPRLASEYLQDIDLYKGRKYDLRFYIVVKSLEPLKILRYARFNARVANHEWKEGGYEDFQTHFTAMSHLGDGSEIGNIRGDGKREDPLSEEFVSDFNETHDGSTFEDTVLRNVDLAVKRVFDAVLHGIPLSPHPTGVAVSQNATWSLEKVN